MTHLLPARCLLVCYVSCLMKLHQEALAKLIVAQPNVATWPERAKVPASLNATDAQLRRELNPTLSSGARPHSRSIVCTRAIGAQFRRNLSDFEQARTFSAR